MNKIFKKITKRILGFLIIIGISRSVFGIQNPHNLAHAQDANTTNTTDSSKITFLQILDILLKIMYVILWPILVLSGLALDNSMVYGSFLHMDAPLWQFWNIIKNFSNFALGFIVLAGILKNIFTAGGNKKLKETITNALIAGVLIQASWFIMAAVIDISTIATYSIGSMPMSILKTSESVRNKQILVTESSLDLNNIEKINEKDLELRYKTYTKGSKNDILIAPCKTATAKGKSYIIGRDLGDPKFKNTLLDGELKGTNAEIRTEGKQPLRNLCVYRGNQIIFFNEFPNTRAAEDAKSYTTILNKNREKLAEITDALEGCKFIIDVEKTNSKQTDDCKDLFTKAASGSSLGEETLSLINELIGSNNLPKPAIDSESKEYGFGSGWLQETAATTIGDIVDQSKGFVGPLVTIYASIMDFANLSDITVAKESVSKGIGETIIKAGVAIGLFFPLIALAIILFIRIGFLRLVIAASPLVVLAKVFDLGKSLGKLGEKISIENILQIVFAPVVTVFALSISLIFMTTLNNMLQPDTADKLAVLENLGASYESGSTTDTLTFFGYSIEYPKSVSVYAGSTGDRFSWMIVNLAGIGIMWFIVFAAITKATGSIGAEVGKSVKTFGENFLKTMPIVPTPLGPSGVGDLYNNFTDVSKYNDYRDNHIVDTKSQEENMKASLEGKFGKFMKGADFGNDKELNILETQNAARFLSNNDIEGLNKSFKDSGIDNTGVWSNTGSVEAIKRYAEEQRDKNVFTDIQYNNVMNNIDNKTGGSNSINKIRDNLSNIKTIDEANTKLADMISKNEINPDNIGSDFNIKIGDKDYTYNKIDKKLIEKPSTTSTTTSTTNNK